MALLPIVDSNTIRGLRELGGDRPEELLDELFDLLMTTAQSQVDEMHSAAKNSDLQQMIRATHTLRGSASSVGAMEVAFLCGQMESTAKSAAAADWWQLIGELEGAVSRLKQALDKLGYRPKPN